MVTNLQFLVGGASARAETTRRASETRWEPAPGGSPPLPKQRLGFDPIGLDQGVTHQVCVLDLSTARGGSRRESTRDKVTREPTGSGGDSERMQKEQGPQEY